MTALRIEGISASSISRITKELDEKVEEFISLANRTEILYLFIDATYIKVRDGLHYEKKLSLLFPESEIAVTVRFLVQYWQTAMTLYSGKISLMISKKRVKRCEVNYF